MELRFFGHAAVMLTSDDGTRLIVDPYNPGGFGGKMNYAPIPVEADAVVCTHEHVDHSAVDDLPGTPHEVAWSASGADYDDETRRRATFGPFDIRGYRFAHDEYEGRRRGGWCDALVIEADGRRVVHLADVGQSPGGRLPPPLRRAHAAIMPVGGFFTIGAAQAVEWAERLAPGLLVPVHYATDRCELRLRPVDSFLRYISKPARRNVSRVEVPSNLHTFNIEVVVLEPEC